MKRSALLLAFAITAVSPRLAGPPWISVELKPAGDQVAWVRTYHHGTPMPLPLNGTAEGLVNGQRRSVTLSFDSTGEMNAFAIRRSWGDDGVWVLNIGTPAEHGGAGAVIGVDRSGVAAWVRYPRNYQGITRMATRGEVDQLLRALDEGRQPPSMARANLGGMLWTGMPLVLLVSLATIMYKGIAAVRARRRALA